MREVILEMKDLSDSREVLEKRIPRTTTVFIAIVLIALGVALIWACFGKLEKYVTGMGEIRPMTMHTMTSQSGGKVTVKNYNNGDTVLAGAILMEFDGTLVRQQKEAMQAQLDDANFKIECYDKLIESIEKGRNLLSSQGAEAQYYYQFESYRLSTENEWENKQQLKATFYTNVASSKDTQVTQRDGLKTELLSLEQSINDLVMTAPYDGVVGWSQSFQIGDTLPPSTNLGTVISSDQDMQVIIYIAEGDIANIEVGQKVEYRVSSLSTTDFDKVSGEVVSISQDAINVEGGEGIGQRFYRVEATLPSSLLTNKDNETMRLLSGMTVQAHVINGDQTIMSWLLNKMGFS